MEDTSRAQRTRGGTPEHKAQTERREFLKKAGTAAVTVPAVALLLSTRTMSAHAQDAISGVIPDLP